MLVSPSLLLLPKIYQVLEVDVEFARRVGYRHVKEHHTGAFSRRGSNTLTYSQSRLLKLLQAQRDRTCSLLHQWTCLS